MKLFFRKALFFIVGLGVILNLLGTLADTTAPIDGWQIELQRHYKQLQTNGSQIEAVTMGNSHSKSIDYDALGMKGQSLALPAADLFEVEKYIYLLGEATPHLHTVFITISYYSFERDNRVNESLQPRRLGFYANLPVWSPIQGDTANFVLGKLDGFFHVTGVIRSDQWQRVWPGLANPSAGTETYDGIRTVSAWGECEHYSADMLDEHASDVAAKNVLSTQQMINAHPGVAEDSFQAISRAIEYLQARGVRVILFTPAYHEKYTQYFIEMDPSMVDRMHEAVSRLQTAYQLAYYDFSTDPELSSHPEFFYNSDHLGTCGQKALSEKLRLLLQSQNTGVQ